MNLQNIRIVLVNTSHPGNIGATARAMKNMGISELFLVNPEKFPDHRATERAAGADDILANAHVVNTLEAAIADCAFVVATSARSRSLPWPLKTPREVAGWVSVRSQAKIAVVFGHEQSGLSNEHLALSHIHLKIPTAEHFSSLNVAAAVQIVVYEFFLKSLENSSIPTEERKELATQEELHRFYQTLEKTLFDIRFLSPQHPDLLLRRLRRLFNRAEMDKNELNILFGILSSINRLRPKDF